MYVVDIALSRMRVYVHTQYRIAGNFCSMYISQSSHKSGFSRIKFCGWPRMKPVFN